MRKYVLLIGVVLMVALLVSANEKADAKTEDLKYDDYYLATKVKAIVENKKENSFKGEIKEDTPEAADWDLKKLYSYFTAYPNGVPATHFAGAYIENGALVIMLSCMEEECITALEEIGFKTEIVWKECAGSFFANMEIVEKMNKAIYEINQRFLMSQCSEDEETLMSYYPCVRYDGKSNTITILFVTETEGLESAIHLFNKLIGEIPECQYRSCEKEEVLGFASTVNVYAGEGIGIQTTSTVISNYSIGFRVYYTSDGETHYGMVTAAHNNSVGNAVYLKPYAVVQDWIGYIDNRCIGGVDDEAFVEVTDIYNINLNQSVYYKTDTYYQNYLAAVLDGTYSTVGVGTTIYKSGRTTWLTYDTVYSTSCSFYDNNVYYYDMIQTNSRIESGGDSGGVCFKISSGTSAKVVGIVRGYAYGKSVFVKAANILSGLGVTIY